MPSELEREMAQDEKQIEEIHERMDALDREIENDIRKYKESEKDTTPEQEAYKAKQEAEQRQRAKRAFIDAGGEPDDFEAEWPSIRDSMKEEEIKEFIKKSLRPTQGSGAGVSL